MTSLQTRTYWREWGLCRKALIRHGYGDDELEAQRHRIHIESLGADKSSKDLTNADFDAILSAFRAYSRPADLAEQLRIIDQPDKRLQAFRDRAERLALELGIALGGRAAWLDTMARRLSGGRAFMQLAETEVAKLCGVLTERVKSKRAS